MPLGHRLDRESMQSTPDRRKRTAQKSKRREIQTEKTDYQLTVARVSFTQIKLSFNDRVYESFSREYFVIGEQLCSNDAIDFADKSSI